jgi:yecA family protein
MENPAAQHASNALTHAHLGAVLDGLKLGVGPSELHGSLTGFLGAGGKTEPRHWLGALHIEAPAAAAADPALIQLYRDCAAALDDPELRFEPLLPENDGTVDARADALVDWCRGFLGGLGLAGGSPSSMSDDASEILRDIGTIAGSRFEYENAEEDESALEEVIEFVRVGVLLLHTEMTAPKRRDITLH